MDGTMVVVSLLVLAGLLSLVSVLLAPGITGYYADKRKAAETTKSSALPDDIQP